MTGVRVRLPHEQTFPGGRFKDRRPGAETEEMRYTSVAAGCREGLRNEPDRDFQQHLGKQGIEEREMLGSTEARMTAHLPFATDPVKQARGVWVARPELDEKVELLTEKQVAEWEDAADYGGLENPAGCARNSGRARDLGLKRRKTVKRALKASEVKKDMDQVFSDLGTERCCCPAAAMRGWRCAVRDFRRGDRRGHRQGREQRRAIALLREPPGGAASTRLTTSASQKRENPRCVPSRTASSTSAGTAISAWRACHRPEGHRTVAALHCRRVRAVRVELKSPLC